MEGRQVLIRQVHEELDICELNLRGQCSQADACPYHHYTAPYLWQIQKPGLEEWNTAIQENEDIERAFCNPSAKKFEYVTSCIEKDGRAGQLHVDIYFDHMLARLQSSLPNSASCNVSVRRLTTASFVSSEYMEHELKADDIPEKYLTQWRWFWQNGPNWGCFGQDPKHPLQAILELKYQAKQDIYRFEVDLNASKETLVFLIDYRLMTMGCLNDQASWALRRRPLFIPQKEVAKQVFLNYPPMKYLPYSKEVPENWGPVDPQQDCELVPLNPESMAFHLVASELKKSLPHGRNICDIFRIQNPYLWHRYQSKKLHMEQKKKRINETQLFHGTSQEAVVQAIFRQNFDCRVCGKNATVFGRGSYFAKDARYSDRYTGSQSSKTMRWMFLVRVLVGTYALGNKDLSRPPPRDANKPHGELFDSCVNDLVRPSVYVIFDSDQCYPDYVISYVHSDAPVAQV